MFRDVLYFLMCVCVLVASVFGFTIPIRICFGLIAVGFLFNIVYRIWGWNHGRNKEKEN